MGRVFFTSDLHFGHSNIIKYSPFFRKFKSADEMDEALVNLWNETIKPDDIVYNLGDVSFHRRTSDIKKVLRRLNGHHILILGNHDGLIRDSMDSFLKEKKDDGNRLFDEIVCYKEISLMDSGEKCHKFVLFHYPILEWSGAHDGTIHLYGHLHDELASIKGRALNVGYDLHGKFLTIDEVVEHVGDIEPLGIRKNKLLDNGDTVETRKYTVKNLIKEINQNS